MEREKINRNSSKSTAVQEKRSDPKSELLRKRKPSFLISPASFLCDLVLRQKLENQLYRSDSFCFLQNAKTASTRKLASVSSKSQRENLPVESEYSIPVDDLSHSEEVCWPKLNLSTSGDSGLGRESCKGPSLSAYDDASRVPHLYENEGEFYCEGSSCTSLFKASSHSSSEYPFHNRQQPLFPSPPSSSSSSVFENSDLNCPLYQSVDETREEKEQSGDFCKVSNQGTEDHVYENLERPGTVPSIIVQLSDPEGIRNDKVYPCYSNSSIPVHRKRVNTRKKLRHRSRRRGSSIYRVVEVIPFESACPNCEYVKSWTIVAYRRRDCCSDCYRCREKKKTNKKSNSMARKRYETAFLPSSSSSPARRSPDVDTLLLAIESTSLDPSDREMKQILREQPPPPPHLSHDHDSHEISPSPLCRPDFFSDDDRRKKKPLSEPLPLKKYSSIMTSGDHHHRPADHEVHLKKENSSISSLESLDSTKSEDLQQVPFVFKSLRSQKVKVLSPISDKSPLEPKVKGMSPFHIETQAEIHGSPALQQSPLGKNKEAQKVASSSTATLDPWDWSNSRSVLNASELTNVPWEMPKLRRRLAMLADSGISLDLPSREFEGDFENRNQTLSSDIFTSRSPRPGSSEGFGAKRDSGTGQQPDKRGLDLRLPLRQTSFPGENMYATEPEEFGGDYLPVSRPNRDHIKLDFGFRNPFEFDPTLELECQDWFHGAITRCEAEGILRPTKEGSFLVRNCESSNFNQYSLSLKCARGFIHIRIEPNSLGTFSLGDQMFPSVPHLVLHFMTHRLPIKGAEHVKLVYPVINQLL